MHREEGWLVDSDRNDFDDADVDDGDEGIDDGNISCGHHHTLNARGSGGDLKPR